MSTSIGQILIFAGLALVIIGALAWSGAFSWFGRLPGDIRIERHSVRVYVPVVSMLLISAALSLILFLIRRLS